MVSGSSGRFKELLGVIMKSEVLDELPEVRPNQDRSSVFSTIMRTEVLPFDETERGSQRAPLAPGLFAPEILPFDDVHEQRRPRIPFMTTLFARETLSLDPKPEPGPVGRAHGR